MAEAIKEEPTRIVLVMDSYDPISMANAIIYHYTKYCWNNDEVNCIKLLAETLEAWVRFKERNEQKD